MASNKGRRRLKVLTGIVVVAAGGVVTLKLVRDGQQRRMTEDARTEGIAALERGDHGAALEHLSYYLQYVKDDVEAIQAFADARMQVPMEDGRHVGESMGLFKESLRLLDSEAGQVAGDPDVLAEQALRKLVELYGMTGHRFEQIKTATRVLHYAPDDVETLSARAVALYLERDWDGAIRDAERLAALEPTSLRWRQLQMEILRSRGESPHEMLARVQSWIDEDPGDVRFRLLRCGLLVTMGRVPEARTEAQAAVELGVDGLEDLQTLMAVLDELVMPEQAQRVIDDALLKFPDAPWVRQAIAHRHWQGGRSDQARAELDAARRQFGTLEAGLLKLDALLAASADETDAVRETLAKLRAIYNGDPTSPDTAGLAWVAAVDARLDLGVRPWPEVAQSIRHAILMQSNDPVLHLIQGEVHLEVGELTNAVASFGQAYRLDPNWAAAGVSYADTLLRVGRAGEALRTSRQVLRRADRTVLAPYVTYARAFLAVADQGVVDDMGLKEQGQQVATVFEEIFRLFPNEPDVAALLAETYVRTGQLNAAHALMRKVAVRTDPDAGVLLALAQVSERHELDATRTLLERAQATSDLTLPVAYALARLEVREGHTDRAERLIAEAMAGAGAGESGTRAAQQKRIAFQLSIGDPQAMTTLREFQNEFADDPGASMFVLGVAAAWDDQAVIETATGNLRRLLGPTAHSVRLAEARTKVRFHADDEATLAAAIMTIAGVLEDTPDSLAALTLMAEASMLGERPSAGRAIEHLERAVTVYPGEASLYPPLIAWLQERGDFDSARKYLQRFGEMGHRDEKQRRAEIRLLQQQGDFETAVLRASTLFGRDGDVADLLALATMHRRTGRHPEAEQVFRQLLARDDVSAAAAAEAADFYAGTGRFEQGRQVLLALDDTRPDINQALLVGVYLHRQQRLDEAAQWLEKAMTRTPHADTARNELARLHLERGNREQARRVALDGLRQDPDNVALRGTLALANLGGDGAGRGEAIELLREVGSENDDLLALLLLLEKIPTNAASLHADAPLLAEARDVLDRHGSLPPTWNLVIRLHVQAGLEEEAIEIARRAVRRFPNDPQPAQWATQVLVNAKRWDEALVEAEEWARRTQDDPLQAVMMAATIQLEAGRATEAVARLDEHATRIDDRIKEDPRWRTRFLAMAARMPDPAALRTLTRVTAATPDDPAELVQVSAAWHALGLRTGDRSMFEKADRAAARAEERAADPTVAWLLRGAIAEAVGDAKTAEQRYRAVLQRRSGHPAALNNLAFLLTRNGRAAEALPLIEQALRTRPDGPDQLDTKSATLRALGRLDEAEAASRRAVELRPDDPSLQMGLARVYMALERPDHARAAVRKAEMAMSHRRFPRRDHLDQLRDLQRQLEQRLGQAPANP